MRRVELPAIVTVGGTEFQHMLGRLWAELDSGAVVHIVDKHSGRHRGWLIPEPPPGSDPVRAGVAAVTGSVGRILGDVRDGAVFEIFDYVRQVVRGYLTWCAPEPIAALGWGCSLQYTTRVRGGRLVYRDIAPTAVRAVLPPRDRDAEAAARVQARQVLAGA